jgi:enterochelin esterase-like enzyme
VAGRSSRACGQPLGACRVGLTILGADLECLVSPIRSFAVAALAALLALALPSGVARAGDPIWVTPAVTAPGVSRVVFDSAAVGAPVSYHVWRPPAYDAQPQRRFPVLYWLHGSGSVLAGIAAVSALFDAAVAAGRIPPLLVVFPNGLEQGMWCNAESGLQPVESMLADDLIADVDARWRTIPQAQARLVEGFSMGGYGAARMALLYPDRFGAASMLGAGPLQLDFLVDDPNLQPIELRRRILAEVYGDSLAVFEARSPWRLAELLPPAPGYRLRQLIGTLDFTLGPNRDFAARLDALGIAHDYREVPGVGHNVPGLVAALGEDFWAFHRAALAPVDTLLADGFE